MFCSQCGHKIAEGAQFCTHCGHPLSRLSSQTLAPVAAEVLCVPVYLNTTLVKTEPYILWLNEQRCCLLKVGKETWMQITAQAPTEKEKVQAFLSFVRPLAATDPVRLLRQFPDSIDIALPAIHQLAVLTYYDSDFHRHMAFDRFTLITDSARFRGAIDYDADIAARRPVLQQLLGNRFSFKEIVHGFDD